MSVELNMRLCEPGNVADGKTLSSFDGFRIGRRRAVLGSRKWLLNTHFVTSDLGPISGNPEYLTTTNERFNHQLPLYALILSFSFGSLFFNPIIAHD
jgi:hypothetical protein